MSSIRETAERIAERYHPSRTPLQTIGLITDIEQALRNERERAAKIVNDARTEGHVDLRSLVTLILADD